MPYILHAAAIVVYFTNMNPFCCASVDDIIEPGEGDPASTTIDVKGEENVEGDQSEKAEESDALSELAEKIVEDIFSKTASPERHRHRCFA